VSHEADEFFSSLLDIALNEFMESDEFKAFMVRSNFAVESEDE
jgi:hypothetical protein